jgi:glycosyltransferase involved in cell wall biosynthesis
LLSENSVADFKKFAVESCADKIIAISNPIESVTVDEHPKEKYVLFVGRLYREAKRPDRIIAVWKQIYRQVPQWKLIIVGDGPLRAELEAYCSKNNIENISFVGQTDPTIYYQKAAIICVTSTCEGFSLVLGEALANGVVPIAFDSYGAVHDLISNNETGLLVKPYSTRKYADALSHLLKDETLLNRLRNNITHDFSFFQKFSMERIVSQWLDLFNTLQNK